MTTNDDILHPRNELSQFTEKVPGAPESGVQLEQPAALSAARTTLTEGYARCNKARNTAIIACGKLAAQEVLAKYGYATYLTFEASDQGENSGLWAVDVTDADGESVGDPDNLYDDITGLMLSLPQENTYDEDATGELVPRFADWLDLDADRINLTAAAGLETIGSAREALDAANKELTEANHTVISASGKLAAETILAEYENAAYLDFECSDQGEESGLWALTITDDRGNFLAAPDDFADDVVEALQNLPQNTLYFTDADGERTELYSYWLNQDNEQIDLRAAARIDLGV